jgi:hypothetical protein
MADHPTRVVGDQHRVGHLELLLQRGDVAVVVDCRRRLDIQPEQGLTATAHPGLAAGAG